jgi:hypothetical protein
MAMAPTRGMCRVDASRASADVCTGMSRVAISDVVEGADGGDKADKWTSVGRWACAGDSEGLGCVRMTMLRGLRSS